MKAGKHQRKKRQESLQLTSAKCTQQHSQHFNSTGHSISDVQVRGVTLCSGTNIQRKQREMRLIFQLGTVQPKGLNINFIFIWDVIYILRAHFNWDVIYILRALLRARVPRLFL